jgi:hypothetical protein
MTKTITKALVAAVITICTACGVMAQNEQPGTYLSPALTGRDFGGVLTGIVVNRPTLVFVEGNNKICPDAAARMERAAQSVPHLAVVIGKPSATSGIKDLGWVYLFTPGVDYRIVHPRTFGMVGFNACAYGDKLVDFLAARLVASSDVLEAHRRIQAIEGDNGEKQALERRISAIEMIENGDEAKAVEISQLLWQVEGLRSEALDLRKKIVTILEQDFADSRLHQ